MGINPHAVTHDFEKALCEYTGAPFAVTTTSCTMALLLAVAYQLAAKWGRGPFPLINIPRLTYIGVPYAIREAGAKPTFRDEEWRDMYQLKPIPVWDSARWFTYGLYRSRIWHEAPMVCVSFHWSKTLGVQQGGAILHDDPEADAWLRRARFDGRAEGVAPKHDPFPLRRAWHAYMSPETAAAGLVRLANLPKHNEPLPWGPGTDSDYPDLSMLEAFR